jgi:HD-GYP domain-containing protein (c-di-GMP phosphodiesterase class II)
VLAVAQVVEVALRIGGLAAAKSVVAQRAGGQLDPRLAAQAATELAGLCEGLGEATVTEHFLAQEPSPARSIAAVQLPQLAEAFGMFADLKSAFMLDHSRRVAALCELAAQHRGLPVAEREPLVLAAHLHDLGRVAIASGLWDKPVRWSEHERKRAETHPLHLLAFMRQSGFLVELAPLAAAAGERLDGSGFPNGLTSARLGDAQRLLSAADVLVALTSARPHRKAYSNSEAARLMAGEVSAGRLDRKAVSAVLDAMALRKPRMEEDLPDGLTGREAGIIRLLAEGLSNKAIAARIGISPRTVQSHVASILGKTGLKGRAAAALYAMRHGLADFQPFGG